jgi:hypothetical protein
MSSSGSLSCLDSLLRLSHLAHGLRVRLCRVCARYMSRSPECFPKSRRVLASIQKTFPQALSIVSCRSRLHRRYIWKLSARSFTSRCSYIPQSGEGAMNRSAIDRVGEILVCIRESVSQLLPQSQKDYETRRECRWVVRTGMIDQQRV